jgi:hypothetical protein
MAEDYTFAELRDMHYLYGAAECNARKAERLYRERFPNRRHPSRKMFVSIQPTNKYIAILSLRFFDPPFLACFSYLEKIIIGL